MLTCPAKISSDLPNGSLVKGFHLVWEWAYCLEQRYWHFLNENEGKFKENLKYNYVPVWQFHGELSKTVNILNQGNWCPSQYFNWAPPE